MFRTCVGWFRLTAIAEAISWAGLLIAMVFKYGFGYPEAVTVMGWVHGLVFTAYVLVSLIVYGPLRWSFRVLVLALVASIPPFASVVFERWALRRGVLRTPEEMGPTSWSRLVGALRALN
ncbi:integral membrane protein [Actinopolyspora biskrensis]|uniref:Integral membrane protein n=1 Tax=Actinopolyspora biskrensis TaxID=1470178 RepID=A0A852Z1G8_9ACTN|nr:integral membrane protein [Actinopolyspora biskrensis]